MKLGVFLVVSSITFLGVAQNPASAAVVTHQVYQASDGQVRQLPKGHSPLQLATNERRTLQPNYSYHALFVPNDPQFTYQWNLTAMNIPAAWDADTVTPIYGGDRSVIVAILDTGLAATTVGAAATVPDLDPTSIWTNSGEVAGDGIDNDGNGRIDDVHGWNFVGNTNNLADDHRHGTHVVQTMVEQMDNSLGSAGVAPNVTVMPLKVLDSAGNGTTETLIAGINYAVAKGAAVINLSLGGNDDDPLLHQAIQAAVAAGVVVVAASGNDGGSAINYPARYTEVIGVGATQYDNTRASYSDYGADLKLVAPGGNDALDQNHDGQVDGILAQTCTSGACTAFGPILMVGTSQAAAQVSAVAGLLRSCGAAGSAISGLLTSTATDLGTAGRDAQFGYGLVNAAAAVSAAGCGSPAPSTPNPIVARAGTKANLPVLATRLYNATKPVFSWSGGGPLYTVTWSRGSSQLAGVTQSSTSYQPTISTAGIYTLSVISTDQAGRVSAPVAFTYHYQPTTLLLGRQNAVTFATAALKPSKTLSINGGYLAAAVGPLSVGQGNRLLRSFQPTGAVLTITDTNGKVLKTLRPFGSAFTGSLAANFVRLADGTARIVVATASRGAALAWYTTSGQLLGRNTVVAKNTQGLTLAVGDLDGNGTDEVIVGQRAGARVVVYNADRTKQLTIMPRGSSFTQGWVVTAGDVDGDGLGEMVLTPNIATTKAKLLVFNHLGQSQSSFTVSHSSTATRIITQTADRNADGIDDIVIVPTVANGTLRVVTGSGKLLTSTALRLGQLSSVARL